MKTLLSNSREKRKRKKNLDEEQTERVSDQVIMLYYQRKDPNYSFRIVSLKVSHFCQKKSSLIIAVQTETCS